VLTRTYGLLGIEIGMVDPEDVIGFVDEIADVFIFLAKFLIATLTTFFSYWLIQWCCPVDSSMLPLLLIFGLTWIIASVFLAIFDVGANTILQCYLLDKEIASYDGLAKYP